MPAHKGVRESIALSPAPFCFFGPVPLIANLTKSYGFTYAIRKPAFLVGELPA